MHAKKTRDRKKQYLEASEQMISEMEEEARKLRDYLVSIQRISPEEVARSNERDLQSKQDLARYRV